jgi:NAD(P)-dependent dehydrogenase (short-subunit alcohol dehydrogenase family)
MADGNPGVMGYIASKHGVVGLIRAWANTLAPRRDSGQHGASDRCQLANDHDEAFGRFVQEFPTIAANLQNPLPVENGLIEPEDVTNTILHLVSDTGRHITGSTVLVDAGFTNKQRPGEGPINIAILGPVRGPQSVTGLVGPGR